MKNNVRMFRTFYNRFSMTQVLLTCAALSIAVLAGGCSRGTPESREADHLARGKKAMDAKDFRKAVIEFKVASQNMPKDVEPLYQLGKAYMQANAAKLAYETFTKAATLNPKHEATQYELALFRVGSNKPETVQQAKTVLDQYIKDHPEDAEAMASSAVAEAKLGNKDAAISLLEAAIVKNPSNVRPASVIIAFYAAKGDTEAAKKIAADLAEKLPNSPDIAIIKAQVSLATHDNADADAQISRALAIKRDFRPALELRLRRELMKGDRQDAEETTQELSKLPEKATWASYGRMLFAEGKVDQAKTEFDRVLKEHADDEDIRNQYSGLLISANRKDDARKIVGGTLAKNPKNGAALLQQVSLEIDAGELDPASKDVKTLLNMKMPSAALSYQQSRIFAARGETTHQGDALIEALKYNPRLLKARLDLAQLLLASGKTKAALEMLEQGNAAEKNTPQYAYYRNMALMADGKWEEAKTGVDDALKHGPAAGFLYQDALVRSRTGDVAGMRKSLEAAFAANPSDPNTLSLLGNVMRQQGEQQKFIGMIRDAAAKNPKSATLQGALGAQLASTGDVNGARSAFEAAKASGDVANAEMQLASVDMAAGNVDKARERLLELVKTHDSARAELLLAGIEDRKGASPEVVVKHYLRALELEPGNVPAMNNLAETLATKQNKLEDAAFWAQKALALAPTSPIVEDTLGWILYRQGKFEASLPYLEKSAKGMDRPVAHYHLAAVLAKAGDRSRAKREYEMALKQDPKSPARAVVEPMIGKN